MSAENSVKALTTGRVFWLAIFFATSIWSAIDPKDYLTWVLEVFPALIGFCVLAATYKNFPLTTLVYSLILLHMCILFIGGHYTYAEMPLFDYLKPLFGWTRNNYDKLGHFIQGFVPALVAREIVIRNEVIRGNRWRNFFIVCFCLAVSATYELIEWLAAVAEGSAADAFLGTQGDIWDTQSDMALALIGSISALLSLSTVHDAQLRRLAGRVRNYR